MSRPGVPSFASSEPDATARFDRWRSTDPFADVPPALLNSADLLDYVATVGMLHPYEVTPETTSDWVKPASCAVGCTDDYLRYTLDRDSLKLAKEPDTGTLEPSSRLRLPANSITFLQLGTRFQIPEYIAARFNLAIREIHRGLLVGTGPLVDPGFVGRLLIPLHNLTSNDYNVAYGEPLVWVEFTKLSPNDSWLGGESQVREAKLARFPDRKLERKTPAAYLDHANAGNPIASSIPQEVAVATKHADKAKRTVRNLGLAGAVALAIAAVGAVWPITSLVSDTNDRVDELRAERESWQAEVRSLRRSVSEESRLIRNLRVLS